MKLNLGCGPNKLEGYTGCDIIDHPGVDVVCSVDSLPFDDNSVAEILCEHLVEHLTYEQFNRSLVEWRRVLKIQGRLIIECPDLLGLCKQFVESNEFGRYSSYKGYWPIICHLYGHQRGNSEEEKFSQIHKSGYTEDYLRSVMKGVGFGNITRLHPVKGVPGTSVLRVVGLKTDSPIHAQIQEIC